MGKGSVIRYLSPVPCCLSRVACHLSCSHVQHDIPQAKFMSGEVDVITGSVAFGMGIDKADVR